MTDYQIRLKTPDGTEHELRTARDVWFEHVLNQPGSAGFSLPFHGSGLGPYDIALCYSQLWIYRNGSLVWAGEIQSRRANSQEGLVTYTAIGWLGLLQHRLVGTSSSPVTYTNEDASDIVDDLITSTQALDDGDWGFTAGNLATSSPHDRTDIQYESLLKVLRELTNDHIQNGIDLEISPDKVYSTWYPQRGIVRPEIVFETGNNIIAWDVSEVGTDMANEVVAMGAGMGESMLVQSASSSEEMQASYGLRQRALAKKDVSKPSTLLKHAQRELTFKQSVIPIISVVVDGGLEPVYGSYGLGDTVRIKIDEGITQIDTSQRIHMMRVKRNNEGAEEARLTFNPL